MLTFSAKYTVSGIGSKDLTKKQINVSLITKLFENYDSEDDQALII